jgi:transposase
MEQLVMNRKEREKLVVFSRVKDRELSRRQAAEILGLSLRQVHRVYRRYLAEGEAGLVHRARGKPSPRQIDERERDKALGLYRELYRGFGPTLLAEKLGPQHGIWVSHDTARRWLVAEGLLERTRRGRRSRRRRLRKERFGQMVQMDGSHHDWFEGRGPRCCLMVVVDDATGRTDGRFFEAETLAAAMQTFGRWCERHGVPRSLYVDRHGIYRDADREPSVEELQAKRKPLTQFGRAMRELDVRLILARSPQAKGRVERANGTLQDRLVKELRLAKVSSVESANAWLEKSGFFAKLSEKFGVKPMDALDAHRPLVVNLADVLCVKEQRSVSLDGCVQWRGRTLQLLKHRAGLRQVEVWEQTDGSLNLLDGGNRLSWQPAPTSKPKPPRKPIVNNKKWKPGPRSQLRLPGSHGPRQPVTFSLRPTG